MVCYEVQGWKENSTATLSKKKQDCSRFLLPFSFVKAVKRGLELGVASQSWMLMTLRKTPRRILKKWSVPNHRGGASSPKM